MRVISGFAAVFFVWCCWLQTNDPDPLLWIAVYGFAGAVSLAVALDRNPGASPVAGLAVYALAVLGHIPHMKPGWWASEEGREGMGLLLCAAWMLVVSRYVRRSRPPMPRA